MNVIYPNAHESGPLLLCLLGVASVFVCFSLMSTAVLSRQRARSGSRFIPSLPVGL